MTIFLRRDPFAKRGRFPVADKAERTIDGIVFDSRREAERYADLKLRERLGHISQLEVHPSWDVWFNEHKFCRYTADFNYKEKNSLVVEEVKSSGTRRDAAYRLRKKAAELAFGFKVTEVF